jgi:fused signal recognition particle receptor
MAKGDKGGFFQRLRRGLTKTQGLLIGGVDDLLRPGRGMDEELYKELEELLIVADVGAEATGRLLESIRRETKNQGVTAANEIIPLLRREVLEILRPYEAPLAINGRKDGPFVVMVIGVNGVGKTTTIGKLAYRYTSQGKKVVVAAADTFRAAAIEQLEIWSERAGAHFVKHDGGSDPAAVAFDAIKAAEAKKYDLLFIDTAGRLHTKENLMEELKRVKRIVGRELADAPHEILLVLDATTGQNAIAQARTFHKALGVTGIALAKLDGTAKGGIIIAIAQELGIPLRFIGVGEEIEDLQDFLAEAFVDALFSRTS